MEPPAQKKQKRSNPMTLPELCSCREWQQATDRAISHPEEALLMEGSSSPLAFACRLGAPASCVKAILDAAPEQIRIFLTSRGTPLHEAVLSDKVGSDVVKALLDADGELEGESVCLLQDVDGHTPLHLLIRRRFQTHLRGDDGNRWFEILQLLIKSSPEAVGIPDRGEYEEPPLVMALKASLYAEGTDDADGILIQRVERRIYEMVGCMLEHYPQAASQVLSGARGLYTALHSAVFHGRCSQTIHLLLQAEQQDCATSRAALLANTQGELPLHFCAMRGEPPRSIALLANAAPMAVLTRDISGLTPFHWLWIRFVSTLLALENDRGDTTVEARRVAATPGNRYQDFSSFERGDFYADLNLIRRLDPPVDFLRMRHIPSECLGEGSDAFQWADRSVEVLANRRQRYLSHGDEPMIVWTRREVVTSLFWNKVVSLLKAADSAMNASSFFHLVQAALACPSCPPPVAQMVCALFPEELSVRDPSTGRLPLHYAACRTWHSWDWPRSDAQGRPTRTSEPAAKLLQGESIAVLMHAIEASPPQSARVTDRQGRLALHHAIDSFVRACSNSGRCYMVDAHELPVTSMLQVLERLVQIHPESLERRDGKTKLYPFLQATAAATEYRSPPSPNGFDIPSPDEMPLSMVYLLLRENPSLVDTKL
jgi:hypothetical protein